MKTQTATAAFKAYLAALSGREASNPHPQGTMLHSAWNQGAISGRDVRKRVAKPIFTF